MFYVYIKTTGTAIDQCMSKETNDSVPGWVLIDSGNETPKHSDAQSNYFEKPIYDAHGLHNYKFVDGEVLECDDSDKAAELANIPVPEPTELDQLRADVDYIAIMGGIEL